MIVGGGVGDQKLATGDAVNVAARLEQAAAPGEVLLGEATYAAVRDAVVAEPAPPIAAKGKSEPVAAYPNRGRTVSRAARIRLCARSPRTAAVSSTRTVPPRSAS